VDKSIAQMGKGKGVTREEKRERRRMKSLDHMIYSMGYQSHIYHGKGYQIRKVVSCIFFSIGHALHGLRNNARGDFLFFSGGKEGRTLEWNELRFLSENVYWTVRLHGIFLSAR